MYVKVTLTIGIDDYKKGASILKALIPDNVNIPQGLEMEFRFDEGMRVLILEFKVTCDANSISTLAASVDEVLEHISVIGRVLGVNL